MGRDMGTMIMYNNVYCYGRCPVGRDMGTMIM